MRGTDLDSASCPGSLPGLPRDAYVDDSTVLLPLTWLTLSVRLCSQDTLRNPILRDTSSTSLFQKENTVLRMKQVHIAHLMLQRQLSILIFAQENLH